MSVFSFLTTTPNSVVKPIHPARMPVMLSGDEMFDSWMDGTADEAFQLAKPFPAGKMHIVHTGETKDAVA